METILIILAIIWVVIPLAAKKKQQDAKAAAERERVARQRAQQAVVPQSRPVRTGPIAPTVRPVMQSSFEEGTGSTEGTSVGTFEGEPAHDVSTQLKQVGSTLKEATSSITHTVSFSGDGGHAHEETSMSGLDASCPPEQATAPQATHAASAVSGSAFVWNVNAARSGLVMAEILGPCLANRDN